MQFFFREKNITLFPEKTKLHSLGAGTQPNLSLVENTQKLHSLGERICICSARSVTGGKYPKEAY